MRTFTNHKRQHNSEELEMGKYRKMVTGVARELIEMFPNGVPEEACIDTEDAFFYSPDPEVDRIEAEDVWEEIQKLQKRSK